MIELYTRHMASAIKADTMSPLTHKQRANILGRFALEHGDRDALNILTKGIRIIINKMADKPGAANNLLKSLRAMCKQAVETGLCDSEDIRKVRTNSAGFVAWDSSHIDKFQKAYPTEKNRKLCANDFDFHRLPPLHKAITAPPSGEMTLLMSEQGKPFSTAGFGVRFKKWTLQAGL